MRSAGRPRVVPTAVSVAAVNIRTASVFSRSTSASLEPNRWCTSPWLYPATRPISAREVPSIPRSTISAAAASSRRRSLSARRWACVRRWCGIGAGLRRVPAPARTGLVVIWGSGSGSGLAEPARGQTGGVRRSGDQVLTTGDQVAVGPVQRRTVPGDDEGGTCLLGARRGGGGPCRPLGGRGRSRHLGDSAAAVHGLGELRHRFAELGLGLFLVQGHPGEPGAEVQEAAD